MNSCVCAWVCGSEEKRIYFHMGFTTKSEIRKELEGGNTDRFFSPAKK